MRIVLTAFAFFFVIVAHAAHIAPWNPCGEGMCFGMSANGGGVEARRVAPDGTDAFSYDMVGNLLSSSNAVAMETFAYDLRDRLTNAVTRVGTNAWESAWLRDAGGLVTNVSYGAGKAVSRTYDLAGRLVAVRDWLGHEWTFSWDAANRPVGGTSPGGKTHSFAYDMAGRLSAWSVSEIAGRTIERDAAGRRTRDTVTAGPMPTATLQRNAENTFDAADRLVSATVAYDGSFNPVQETFLYDGNGAMTNATSGGETVFAAAYDAQGRLASLGGPPSSAASFSYDALGNRVLAAGRIFVPDHSDPLKRPLMECGADGTPLRYYIWGPGRLLGFIDAGRAGSPLPADVLTVAHSDEQGSVIAFTDETGALLYRANYSPHGEDWGSSGTNATPFAWLGGLGVMRTEGPPSSAAAFSTLYLTRHRLYSPVLRRFLSADPLGIDGGLNLYAYANGNPLAYIDPLGLCASDDKWYDRFSAWTLEKVGIAKDYYGEHLPWWMAGTVATAMDLVTSVAHFPAAIGHLGEGAGTFAGNPSLETAAGLCGDIATVAGVANMAGVVASSFRGGGLQINQTGKVLSKIESVPRVRHHTSVESLRKIQMSQEIWPARGNPIGVHVETQPFGPVSSASSDVGAFGRGAYIEFDQPQKIVPTYVGPRNTGVIPTQKPFNIENLHPLYWK